MPTYIKSTLAPAGNWTVPSTWTNNSGYPGLQASDSVKWSFAINSVSSTATANYSALTFSFPILTPLLATFGATLTSVNLIYGSGVSFWWSWAGGASTGIAGGDFVRLYYSGNFSVASGTNAGATINPTTLTLTNSTIYKLGPGVLNFTPSGFTLSGTNEFVISRGIFVSQSTAFSLPIGIQSDGISNYSFARAPAVTIGSTNIFTGPITLAANSNGVLIMGGRNTLTAAITSSFTLENNSYLNILGTSGTYTGGSIFRLANAATATINFCAVTTTGSILDFTSVTALGASDSYLRTDGMRTPFFNAGNNTTTAWPRFIPTTTIVRVAPIFGYITVVSFVNMVTPTNVFLNVPLTLIGNTWIEFVGKSAANTSQTFTSTQIGSSSQEMAGTVLNITQNSSTACWVNLGSISRVTGRETVSFKSNVAAGANFGFRTTNTNTFGIMGGWATSQAGVPATNNVANTADTWAVSNGSSSGITGLTTFTNTSTAGTTPANYTNQNILVDDAVNRTLAAITPNSWIFNAQATYTLSSTMTLTSGGILFRSFNTNSSYRFTGGTITTSSGPLFIHSGGSNVNNELSALYIDSELNSATGDVVFAGKSYTNTVTFHFNPSRTILYRANPMNASYIQGSIVEITNPWALSSFIYLMSAWSSNQTSSNSYLNGSQLGLIGSNFQVNGSIYVRSMNDNPTINVRRYELPPVYYTISIFDSVRINKYIAETAVQNPVFDYTIPNLYMQEFIKPNQPRGLFISLYDSNIQTDSILQTFFYTQWLYGSQVNVSITVLNLLTNSFFQVYGGAGINLTLSIGTLNSNGFPTSFILINNASLLFPAGSFNLDTLNIYSRGQIGSAVITPGANFIPVTALNRDISIFQTAVTVIGSNLGTGFYWLKQVFVRNGASLTFGKQNILASAINSTYNSESSDFSIPVYTIEGFGSINSNSGVSSPNATGYLIAGNGTYFQTQVTQNTTVSDGVGSGAATLSGRIQLTSGNESNLLPVLSYTNIFRINAAVTEDATGSYGVNYFGTAFVNTVSTYTNITRFNFNATGTTSTSVLYTPQSIGGTTRTISLVGLGGTANTNPAGLYLRFNTVTNPIVFGNVPLVFARSSVVCNLGQIFNFPSITNTYTMSSNATFVDPVSNLTNGMSSAIIVQSGVTLTTSGIWNISQYTRSSNFYLFRTYRYAQDVTTVTFSHSWIGSNYAGFGNSNTTTVLMENESDQVRIGGLINWNTTTLDSGTPLLGSNTGYTCAYHKLLKNNGFPTRQAPSFFGGCTVDFNGYSQSFYLFGSAFNAGCVVKIPGGTVSLIPVSAFALLQNVPATEIDGTGGGTLYIDVTSTVYTMSAGGRLKNLTFSGSASGVRLTAGSQVIFNTCTITTPLRLPQGSGGFQNVGIFTQGVNSFDSISWYGTTTDISHFISNEAQYTSENPAVNTINSVNFDLTSTTKNVIQIKANSLVTAPFTITNLSVGVGITAGSLLIVMNAPQFRDILTSATYPLITVTGSAPANWDTYFSFATEQFGSSRFTRTLSFVGNTLFATLNVNRLVWTGAVSGVWGSGVANWSLQSNPAITTFTNLDAVLFDDTGNNTTTISLNSNFNPVLVNFNNSTKNYILGGSFAMSGSSLAAIYKQGTGAVQWGILFSSALSSRPGAGIYVMQGTFALLNNALTGSTFIYVASGAKLVFYNTDNNISTTTNYLSGVGGTIAVDPHRTGATASRTVSLNFQPARRSNFQATILFENTFGGASTTGSYLVSGVFTTINLQSNITIPAGVSFACSVGNTSYYPNDWTLSGSGYNSGTANTVQTLTGLSYYGYGALCSTVSGSATIWGNITLTGHTKISFNGTGNNYPSLVGYTPNNTSGENVSYIIGNITGAFNLVVGHLGTATLITNVCLLGTNSHVDTWIGDETGTTSTASTQILLVIGANTTSGTLGTGTTYINAAGRSLFSELMFNRTDTYNLPGSIRAYLAGASYGAILSIDTGTVRTDGRTVNLTDLAGSGRVGNIIIGRNPWSGAASREFRVTGGSTVTAGGLLFNVAQGLNHIAVTNTVSFGGNTLSPCLVGTGTLTVEAGCTLSLTSMSICSGNNSSTVYNGSYVSRQFYAFEAIVNVEGNLNMTTANANTFQGMALTVNVSGSGSYTGNFAISLASAFTLNLSGSATITTSMGVSNLAFRSSVWNLSGGTIIPSFSTSYINYSSINVTNTVGVSGVFVGGVIAFVSVAVQGIANYGSITGGGVLNFSGATTLINFQRSVGSQVSFVTTVSSGIRYIEPQIVDCIIAGSPGGFNVYSSNYVRFSRLNTTSSSLIVEVYGRVDFYSSSGSSGWAGPVQINTGAQISGNGTLGSLAMQPSSGTDGSSIIWDSTINLAQPLTVTGTFTANNFLYFTLQNLPFYTGTPITLLNYGGNAGVFTPITSSSVRSAVLTTDPTSITLTYQTQTSTWVSGDWDDNPNFSGSIDNYAKDGDRVVFNNPVFATIRIKRFVSPCKITVENGAYVFRLDSDEYDTSGGFLTGCTEGIVITNGTCQLDMKRTNILGPITVTGSQLRTYYRNVISKVPSITLNNLGNIDATDLTSVNGVTLYLQTGSLNLPGTDITLYF